MESTVKETPGKELKLDDLTESILDGLDDRFTSTQNSQVIEDPEKLLQELEQNLNKTESDKMYDSVLSVDNSTKKVNEKSEDDFKTQLLNMEEKYKTDKSNNVILQGQVNSLEEDKTKLRGQLNRTLKLVNNHVKSGENKDSKIKVAKLKKELKKANERKEDLLKEVELLKVSKAQTEADKNKMTKMYELLEEALDNKKKDDAEPSKPNIKCREYEKGSCSYKERCRFVHQTTNCEEHKKTGQCGKKYCLELHNSKGNNSNQSNNSQQDCRFWLEGNCRF